MRFGGKELDPESALMNFEARYYRNTWGRFTQVDPVGGSLGDTQSWNRYAYARNNPLRFVDPTGMDEACPWDSCVTGDMPVGKTFDGTQLIVSPYSMTPSPGDDLGPYGCGWTPDSNGNFYMWNSGCSLPTMQYTTELGPPGPAPVPDPKDPEDPCKTKGCGGGDPTPAPAQPECQTPSYFDRALMAGVSFLSRVTGRTMGVGSSVEGGVGIGGAGIAGSKTKMIVASPDGRVGYQQTKMVAPATGGGITITFIGSVSNAKTIGDLAGPFFDGGLSLANGGAISLGGAYASGVWQLSAGGGIGEGGLGIGGFVSNTVVAACR